MSTLKPSATKKRHDKQVIGYLTQYDAWKDVPGLVPKGGYNQLNVDFSKYTILNFSFFGLARDGTLHSGDYRNTDIWQAGTVQEPAPLIHKDIYSSFDMYILYGELETIHWINAGTPAYNQGYRNDEVNGVVVGWKNVTPGKEERGPWPLLLPVAEGKPGLLQKAKDEGVKAMASLGGWSMSKHFCEVAADTGMRKALVNECINLIKMGFDGIDFDWEYPNAKGMNIENYSPADYGNFATLMEDVREAIGSDKLITAAMSASPAYLEGFDWARLQRSMDYFNIMTYDINGGWSDTAGHNSPLFNYPGAKSYSCVSDSRKNVSDPTEKEASPVSLDSTTRFLLDKGVAPERINLGVAFYGRGVITEDAAALNGRTVKKDVFVQPDGPISSCGDFDNWALGLWDATPLYSVILQKTGSDGIGGADGWKYNWDVNAKVPYLTKDKYFLSYDNERSIKAKAEYIKEKGLAGVIIWHTYGDLLDMTKKVENVGTTSLKYCPEARSPLVDVINEVFASDKVGF
ncbi:chitinase [Collimonas sp. PA-H2]|uniref:glycoside hydrolase family 18 protein n=1 Tax=Collimonas sp. PA-H2 TaxID=1881062 RepID=UPI000BF33E6C|nr:glycosyl hydrolase family 18 protein [Collimonas sp. PA-H2]PFH07873.1 chitinase [Collimonas sp. PA-H2]